MTPKLNELYQQILHNTKVDNATNCWIWNGKIDNRGYGKLTRGSAHRIAYEHQKGPIPKGNIVHHACRNKLCANAEHLHTMTNTEHSQIHKDVDHFSMDAEHGQIGRDQYKHIALELQLEQFQWAPGANEFSNFSKRQFARATSQQYYAKPWWRLINLDKPRARQHQQTNDAATIGTASPSNDD